MHLLHVCLFSIVYWIVHVHCSKSFPQGGLLDVEHIIKKRQLREAGFTQFHVAKLHWSHEQDGIATRVNTDYIRRKRDVTSSTVLHLDADMRKFNLKLKQAPSVINRNTVVELREGANTRSWMGDIPNCFLVGHLQDNERMTASFSYCSHLMGSFNDGIHNYWVEYLGVADQSTDNPTEHVIMGVSNVTSPRADDCQTISQKQDSYMSNPFKLVTGGKTDKHRYKRATYPILTIEGVIISDTLYTQYMHDLGFTTDEQKIELLAIKANGAQAEWARADVLKYDIRFDIKLVELWTTDPAYYNTSSLGEALESICFGAYAEGMYLDFDHIFLNTGSDKGAGKAYVGEMCHSKTKCSVVGITDLMEYAVLAHEIGHNMGMYHDVDEGCSPPDNGLMGSRSYGWSSCSVKNMHTFLSKGTAGCLTEVNVNVTYPSAFTIKNEWPGMTYTVDELCEAQHGPGFRMRLFPYSNFGACSYYSCMNMDVTSSKYGTSANHARPAAGTYCGVGKVCSIEPVSGSYPCVTWEETGLDMSLFVQVPGEWSEWGSQTTCSRTCGTGVYYRQRRCDNPKPKNSAWCVGEEYEARLCNTDPCPGDETSVSELIYQRAGETCTHVKANNLYPASQDPANYLNTGRALYRKFHGQCEVWCNVISGFEHPDFQRDGLMPDGTPCIAEELSTFTEIHGLVRKSGMYSKCLQGYCQLFGCNDVSGATRIDICGECGGDGTGCQEVTGNFTADVATDARADVVEVPSGAFRFQSYFYRITMKTYWLELWSNNGTAIIAFNIPGPSQKPSTVNDPVEFAGARWFYLYSKTFLYAEGNLTESVVIKLFNSNGSIANTGVLYAYSIPGSTIPVTLCDVDDVNNAIKIPNKAKIDIDSTVTYECDSGFEHTSGTLTRKCLNSGTLDGLTPICTDIDECTQQPCENGGTCENIVGSYVCTCPTGYSGKDCGTVQTCDADDVNNAAKSPNQAKIDFNTKVTYVCNAGNDHTGGTLTRTCLENGTLDGQTPTCTSTSTVKTCDADDVNNAAKSPNQAKIDFNTKVTYVCNAGNDHTGGTLTRTCLENGTLDGQTPTCTTISTVKTCDANDVNEATKTPNQAKIDVNDIVTYECITGYEHTGGHLVRKCLDIGALDGLKPTCTIKMCDADDVNNAAKSPNQAKIDFNTKVTYVCNAGNDHTGGTLTRTCLENGTLDGQTPTCTTTSTVKTCDANDVNEATKTPNQAKIDVNDIVTYECITGYEHTGGHLVRKCLDIGALDGLTPTCTSVRLLTDAGLCNVNSHTSNFCEVNKAAKTPNQAKIDFNTKVTYVCNAGNEHSGGNLTRTCLENGTLDGQTPTCTSTFTVKTCDANDVNDSTKTPNIAKINVDDTVTYECITGYEHTGGNLVRKCLDSGSLDGQIPTCIIKTCEVGDVNNATKSPNQAKIDFNTKVTYVCKAGNDHTGRTLTRTCLENGTLDGQTPTCTSTSTVTTCDASDVNDSTKTPNIPKINVNDAVTYECVTGYKHTGGNLARKCLGSGALDGQTPTCTIKTCETDDVNNATKTPNQANINFNTQVTYACNTENEHTGGTLTRSCLENGTLDGQTPTCISTSTVISCDTNDVNGATKTPNQAKINVNDKVTYECITGYEQTSGDLARKCMGSGTLDGQIPTCTIKTCDVNDVNDATKSPNQAKIDFNDKVTYKCITGYVHTDGNLVRKCLESGTLDGQTPTCNTSTTTATPPTFATSTTMGNTSDTNTTTTTSTATRMGGTATSTTPARSTMIGLPHILINTDVSVEQK